MYYREQWLKKSAVKSILTCLSLDALGSAYSHMPVKTRISWIDGGRAELPRGARRTGTHNTDITTMLLILFYQFRLEPSDPTDKVTSYLRQLLRGYEEAVAGPRSVNPYVLALRGIYNTSISLPIGVAIGYYVALNADDGETLCMVDYLIRIVKTCIPLNATNVSEVRCLAIMLVDLLREGYFGVASVASLYKYNAVPNAMFQFFDLLLENMFNADWLTPHFTHVSLHSRMSYAQRVIAEAMYYMTRVSTNYDLGVLASNPKKQLIDIFSYPYTVLPDIAFLYGAICTSSEHGYSLVPKPFRLAIDHKHDISGLIDGRWKHSA